MLRFAPRYGIVSPALVRASRMVLRLALNDNAPDFDAARANQSAALDDARVQAALRLFAVNMSSFAFGMILIAAGVVAYLINHALKPSGWGAVPNEKAESAA